MSQVFDHNAFIGTTGTLLSISLSQINVGVSILVGIATLVYMVVKIGNALKDRRNGIQ
jgi:uncharacterized oligopeptide transporter (OPT) family protein